MLMYPHVTFLTPVELKLFHRKSVRQWENKMFSLLQLYFFENIEINGLRGKNRWPLCLFVRGVDFLKCKYTLV